MSLEDLTPNQLLDHAKKLEDANRLYGPLMADPETRPQVLALMKKKWPTMPIPEVDSANAMEQKLAEERAAREKLEATVRDERLTRQITEARDRVKKQYDLTDSDMGEVEKIMLDEKAPIPHWDAAAKVFKASRAQATPTAITLEAPIYEMPAKDVWARGIGNKAQLDRIAMKEATAALNDITSGRVKVS